jgi:hypothetical protein
VIIELRYQDLPVVYDRGGLFVSNPGEVFTWPGGQAQLNLFASKPALSPHPLDHFQNRHDR